MHKKIFAYKYHIRYYTRCQTSRNGRESSVDTTNRGVLYEATRMSTEPKSSDRPDEGLSRSKPTTEEVYEQLKDLIANREIKMGEKIIQAQMAERLNASRTPVINALHKLVSEGLVDARRHSGFYVHKVSVKEMADLFELRKALDMVIADDLCPRITDEQIRTLRAIFAPFDAAERIDTAEYAHADVRFHALLMWWCGNEQVQRVNETLQVLNRTFVAGLIRPPRETLPEHHAIIDSFAQREVRSCARAMRNHIAVTSGRLRDMVESLRRINVDPASIPIDEVDMGNPRPG